MDKLITEDILKQIRLINYERSKTLSEQSVIGAPNYGTTRYRTDAEIQANMDAEELQRNIDKNCNSLIKSTPRNESEKTAKKIFLILKNQIDSGGTKEQIILDALKLIDSQQTYIMLMIYIYGCYPQNYGMTILQFIQSQEFSLGSFNSSLRHLPMGMAIGQKIQWEFNDSWLEKYQKILQKFNSEEKYEKESFDADDNSVNIGMKLVVPPYAREVAHIVIPILSIVISLIPGIGTGIGGWLLRSSIMFGVESVDAAIYKWGDENDYAAGLALLFAFAGPLDNGLNLLVKNYGATLLKKIALNSIDRVGAVSLTKGELELLANITVYSAKYTKLTKIGLARQFTKQIITKAKNSSDILKFILKLSEYGLLTAKFTGKIGLLIGGTFYTWDAIAKHLGVCNSMPLNALTQSDWLILKAVGKAGNYIQPFSTPCDQEAVANKLKAIKTDNDLFVNLLETAKKENKTYSTKYSYYNINVLIAQYVFYAAGLDVEPVKSSYFVKNNILTINNSEDIKNVSMYTSTGTLIKTINNENNSKVLTYNFGNLRSVVIMRFTMFDKTTETKKLFAGKDLTKTEVYSSGNVGQIPLVEWGVFDKSTEKLVNIYQKQNKLSVDGKIGPETLSKLISDLKAKKYGVIKNLNNENFDKIRVAEVKAVYDEYLKQKDKLLIDEKIVLDALEKDKANRGKLADDVSDALENADNMSNEEFVEMFGKYDLPK
jgi:peptidoglycan hydrolase-like protein with peptidoglycan-binding domain